MLIALTAALLAAVPAVGQQEEQDASQQSSATDTDKKEGGDVSIQSTTPVKASFASGTGANRLAVQVSNHGNLVSFESPAGEEAVFGGNEGYAVCSGDTVYGHDTGPAEGGFGTPTFVQPTAGAFPLTVTRNTTDGKFQLKQVWNKPDATEKDVTVTMTLTNRSSSTINGVELERGGDIDASGTSTDRGARTGDSAWLWDDASDSLPSGGMKLTALSFGTAKFLPFIEPRSAWANSTTGTRTQCGGSASLSTPAQGGDLAMGVSYFLGNIGAGQSKTVKFGYGRM